MSYATLLETEGTNPQFLAILSPRKKVTSWTLFSGSVYSNSFDYGYVSNVSVDGTNLTLGVSSSLSAGGWFYDSTNEVLYIRCSDSGSPSNNFVVVTYQLYVGTFDAHWYRDPLDSSTASVYYEPLIQVSPSLKQTVSDSLFGFLPIQRSSITLSDAEHTLQRHLYYSSFSKASIKLYHWIDTLAVANIKLVLNGIMNNQDFDGKTLTISLSDRVDILDKEYRHAGSAESFFATSDFAGLDPQFQGRPIKRVCGYIESGFQPVNVDYVQENPGTSDNRDWVVMTGQSDLATITSSVPASPSSTTTRTYFQPGEAQGINVGDTVWINGGTDYFVIVTVVDPSFNYIEHAAIGAPASTADTLTRGFIGFVKIVQNDVTYTALLGRDYTLNTSMAGGTVGFSFTTSLESNLSIPETLSSTDVVYCRVYGKKNVVTLSGGAFGSNDSSTLNLTHPTVILFDIMKTNLGLAESEMNLTSFTDTRTATSTEAVGFSIPEDRNGDFPTYKELILNLLNTQLAKLFLDNDLKWKLDLVEPYSSEDKSIDDTEILRNNFEHSFDYSDVISDVFVEYKFQEISDATNETNKKSRVSSSSDNANYLHQITKQKTFKSYHIRSVDAQNLCDHIGFILGERKGTVEIKTKNRFFNSLLNDVIEISRTKQAGFEFDEDTERALLCQIIEVSKSLKNVKLILDDSKGMNDNLASW